MRRLCSLLVTFFVLTGCASTAPVFTPNTARKVGEAPELASLVERSVGDVLYETYNYEELVGARLLDSVAVDVFIGRVEIPAQEFLVEYREASRKVYCSRKDSFWVTLGGNQSPVCLVDYNADQLFDSWRAPEGPPARQKWRQLETQPRYRPDSLSEDAEGFRYELLYQGLSSNVVHLLYREYLGDLIRPAFQQELNYTLAAEGPTEASFRAVRIRIHSADNNSIRYEILSGLGRPEARRP